MSITIPHIDSYVADIIISYLPYATQLKIDKKRYHRTIVLYNNAKNVIARSIKFNRNRMNEIMEMTNIDEYFELNVDLVRSHYILHYPDEYRWEFYKCAFARRIRTHNGNHNNKYLDSLVLGDCNLSVKYLFKQIILTMNLQELFINGW